MDTASKKEHYLSHVTLYVSVTESHIKKNLHFLLFFADGNALVGLLVASACKALLFQV